MFNIVAARVKATVEEGCSDYLDCRNPSNESQFIDALQTYYARKASQLSDGMYRQRFPQQPQRSVWCHICKKSGHKPQDCWWRQESEISHPVETDTKSSRQTRDNGQPSCYACHEVGHIKPYCPKRQQQQQPVSLEKPVLPQKDNRKIRRLSAENEVHQLLCVEGLVDGTRCRLILDSAASISLFPAEKVRTRDGGSALVVYGTERKSLETAVVEVKIGERIMKKRVALLPEGDMKEAQLYNPGGGVPVVETSFQDSLQQS